MQNDPVLVEKVARAIHDAGFPPAARDTAWEDVVWRDCATGQAHAALSVIDNEMGLASAASQLGKDQVQTEASRHVVPPEWQPIETAPKDGTSVLVGWYGMDAAVAWFNGMVWRDDFGEWSGSNAPHFWSPLPSIPAPGIEAPSEGGECTGASFG